MLETFGLCEYSLDRSCQLRAMQRSLVSARAPSRLLSIEASEASEASSREMQGVPDPVAE